MRPEQRPIFVVGASRSGTGLMRRCLNGHPDVYLSGETHYFDHLRPELGDRGRGKLSPPDRQRCEDYFLALAHRAYGQGGDPSRSPLSRAELRGLAQSLGQGSDAYFESFCRLQAAAHGASRWGEKTPRHVLRIDEMLARYPKAQVICLVRDPRAVVASQRNWATRQMEQIDDGERLAAMHQDNVRKTRSYDPLLSSMMWRTVINAATRARATHGAGTVLLQPFEALVGDPRGALQRLCQWLELDFSESMLQVGIVNSSFGTADPNAGFASGSVERWRAQLSDWEIAVIQSACRRLMQAQGYKPAVVAASPQAVVAAWARLPFTSLRATAANADRTGGSTSAYVWRRLRAAVRS